MSICADYETRQNRAGLSIGVVLHKPRFITGHIDFLQVRNGAIHILDYKPDARTNKPFAQLTIYALALTRLVPALQALRQQVRVAQRELLQRILSAASAAAPGKNVYAQTIVATGFFPLPDSLFPVRFILTFLVTN